MSSLIIPSLRHLQILRLFSQSLSVTETARLAHVSQPAVSQALKELESHFNLPLFTRVGGRLQLTAEGSAILENVETLFDQVAALRQTASRLRGERNNTVSIVSVYSIVSRILADAIMNINQKARGVRIKLDAYSSREVVSHVKNGNAEIGFAFLPIDESDLVVEPLLTTSITCLMSVHHRLATQKRLSAADLVSERLITVGSREQQLFDILGSFAEMGYDPPFLETNISLVGVDLLRDGTSIALALPVVLSLHQAPEIATVPFEPEIRRTLAVIHRRKTSISDTAASLIERVRESLEGFHQELNRRGVDSRLY